MIAAIIWWSMDGGWLDDRRYNHGDHHNRPAVDTAAFNIGVYTLLPFGQKAVSRVDYYGHHDLGTGPLGVLGNVLCLVLAGWWLALLHLFTAIILAITIVGIPFAWAHVKLAGLALRPIGKMIVPA